MKRQTKWTTRTITAAAAFSLLTTSAWTGTVNKVEAAASTTAQTAATAGFSDVTAKHWAAKHIAKLASQGIVKGINGQFKPNDNITHQEAVVMAIRFIGKESEVDPDSAVVFASGFEVSTYFKPYVTKAFELGLLDRDEEFKLAEDNPDTAWGSTKASREWVTKLIVKAINEQKKAESLASAASSFQDSAKIGADYVGYVNAGVELQLIKGITAEKFDPKGFITRASIATIFSRAEAKFAVKYAGQAGGIATTLTKDGITFYEGGSEKSYKLTANTLIYRHDSEQLSSLDKLVLYTNYLVIADSNNNVLYLEQLDDTQQVEKVSGVVDRVLPASNTVWIWVNDEPVKVTYDAKTVVKDGSGSAIAISSLAKDSKVVVTRDKFRAAQQTLAIEVESAPVNKTIEGIVSGASAANTSITIVDPATDASSTYSVAPDAIILWQGTVLAEGLAGIKNGDTVSVEVKNSKATKITVQQTSALTVTGNFVKADASTMTINYTRNGVLEAKYVADNVEVLIDGLSGATLADLQKDDQIQLTLNGQQKVTSIKAINRSVKVMNGATILSFDADINALQVRDAVTNALLSVYLTDTTRVTTNDSTIPLTAAKTMLVKNRKVSVGYVNDKAVFVQFVTQYSGKVLSVNTTTRQIKLDLGNNSSLTLPIIYDTVEMQGKYNATLADIKVGDTVTGLLNTDQNQFLSIRLHKQLQAEVVSTSDSGKKLTIKGSDGTTTEVSTAAIKLLGESGENVSLSAFAAGKIVNLTYVGTTPSSAQLVSVKVGRVTGVAADKITYIDYNGSVSTETLTSGYSVVKNGTTSASASVLAVGDRVEVRKGASGALLITALTGLNKTFDRYDAVTGTLYVRLASLSDTNYTFAVTSSTKVTQGDAAIALSALAADNKLVIYVYQGKVLEIVKVS
ncbi:S-layer homology domain-containing protein [Paenibacillus methanolicus]|uniref:S-layer family protein n=1 Tax=Paenibacillus methanolicus TaxID=582686 RepID=A0A5S5BZM2_9BACL|nr:S-layer homology domain-containing protein [Paenibacillus methanolicus]TYP72631.1 S-layer family protein [Paenibacillus methanolicus]